MIRTALALAAASIALFAPAAADAAPTAEASKSCSVGTGRGYGTTYVLSIKASGVSCRKAKRVVKAFHACRPGKSGRCSRVDGWSCSEDRFNRLRGQQYSSRVTCRKGGKTVKHTYQQWI
jgi:hypothetical protein